MSGSRYWSQIIMNPKMVATPSTGLHSGRMMLQSMRISPTPSSLAASSISLGMSFMNSVMMRMEKPHMATGRMTPKTVPRRLMPVSGSPPSTCANGTAITSSGSIIVSRKSSRTTLWPLNRNLERAYAVRTRDRDLQQQTATEDDQ